MLATVPGAAMSSALTHAPIGAAIVDNAGAIIWANSAFAAIAGEADASTIRHSLLYARHRSFDTGRYQVRSSLRPEY